MWDWTPRGPIWFILGSNVGRLSQRCSHNFIREFLRNYSPSLELLDSCHVCNTWLTFRQLTVLPAAVQWCLLWGFGTASTNTVALDMWSHNTVNKRHDNPSTVYNGQIQLAVTNIEGGKGAHLQTPARLIGRRKQNRRYCVIKGSTLALSNQTVIGQRENEQWMRVWPRQPARAVSRDSLLLRIHRTIG